jgi:adenine/guanine phosphoribosyltransferase-like PRPP-binding protein
MYSNYLFDVLNGKQLQRRVRLTADLIRDRVGLDTFRNIAFRGISGALVAPALAVLLEKNLLVVRKPNESAHTRSLVEGNKSHAPYIIVDDFISSGDTIRHIVEAVKAFDDSAKLVAIVCYARHSFRDYVLNIHAPVYHTRCFEKELLRVSSRKGRAKKAIQPSRL